MAQNHAHTAAIHIPDSVPDRTRPSNAVECSRCDNWWAGLSPHHCGSCHQTFTSLTAFDAHRDGNHAHDTRHCVDPSTVGLVRKNRAYPCWGFKAHVEWWPEGDQ